MVKILTNTGYIDVEKLEEMLSTAVISKPRTYNGNITYALTDANNGKTFSISTFPTSCTIREII